MAFFKSVSKPGFRDKIDSETRRKKSDSGDELGPRFALKTSDEVRVGPERVGLVTLEELKAQKEAEERRVAAEERKETAEESSTMKEDDCVERGPISFSYDDTDEEDESNTVNEVNNEKSDDNGLSLPKKKRYGVNPNVDIRFIPDIYRKEEEVKLREELKKEWMEMQIAIKNEEIKFLYSYWDGSGHRKEITVRKGDSIQTFLNKCLEQLRREFPDLKTASADKLMYIKDDLIIPHHNTFYDFIVSKAKGKSGPLFNFEDRANLRIVQGVIMEEDGKICLRSWYERNKHIFPASRWEPYDPIKNWDNCSELDKLSAKIIVK